MHGLVPEDGSGIGVCLNIVDLDGDHLISGDVSQNGGVIALIGTDPVPGVQG